MNWPSLMALAFSAYRLQDGTKIWIITEAADETGTA